MTTPSSEMYSVTSETPNILASPTVANVNRLVFEQWNEINGLLVNPSNTIIVSGFWRSGTTWLQEQIADILNAKRIFEPFQGRAEYILECFPEIPTRRKNYGFYNGFMPYVPDYFHKGTNLFRLVHKAQRGQLSHRFVLRDQYLDFKRCFNRKIVVKYTRAALCLRALANTFSCPIIHIYRDPRAIIASLKKYDPNWGEGAFSDFSLYAHLLEVDDGRRSYFQTWQQEIKAIEQTNDYGRLAAYYCLTERYLADSFAREFSGKFVSIRYEDLLQAGIGMLFVALQELGRLDSSIDDNNNYLFNRPSGTRHRSQEEFIPHDHLLRWKSKLTEDETNLIQSVVADLGMGSRLVDP